MVRLEQIKLPVGHDQAALQKKIRKKLKLHDTSDLPSYRIVRRSLDARRKPELFFVYTIDIEMDQEEERRLAARLKDHDIRFIAEERYLIPERVKSAPQLRPVVIGSGPAGLFCAYLLAMAGMNPIIAERGETIEKRSERVNAVWEGERKLHPESNVQFGEGGAGTFSDGKLNTLVKDKNHRNRFVLDTFVRFGAPDEIAYLAKPHLGTDVLKTVIKNMRDEITSLGGTFLFGMRLDMIRLEQDGRLMLRFTENFEKNDLPEAFLRDDNGKCSCITDRVILAIGHSARDTFVMLYDLGVHMEQKNFAVGLRIEHLQKMIDLVQYGQNNENTLPPADYKLTRQCENGRAAYSFCMCPGGYVVNASSEDSHLAVNGMSYHARDSVNANAAIIVSVDRKDFGSNHPLAGIGFQRQLEKKAYEIGKGAIPVQRFGDFENNTITSCFGKILPMMKGKYRFANLRELFERPLTEALIEAIKAFDKQIPGFSDPDAVLSGVESRTSSPVRIVRDQDYLSNMQGIYPCGEGAGYAGGITSAAMDGMKVAEAIIAAYQSE